MFVLPNSAPDSLTPKNLNLVRLPEHRLELGDEAVEVPLAEVLAEATGVVAVPGWH